MSKFRTKATAAIEVADRKIGTIGGWVEHELELGIDLLKQLKGLVVAGVATVQVFKPELGWSPDVPVEVLDRMIDAGSAVETAVKTIEPAAEPALEREQPDTGAGAKGDTGTAPADGPAPAAEAPNAPAANPIAAAGDASAKAPKPAKAK